MDAAERGSQEAQRGLVKHGMPSRASPPGASVDALGDRLEEGLNLPCYSTHDGSSDGTLYEIGLASRLSPAGWHRQVSVMLDDRPHRSYPYSEPK